MPKRNKGGRQKGIDQTDYITAQGRRFIANLITAQQRGYVLNSFILTFTDLIAETKNGNWTLTQTMATNTLQALRAELIRFKPKPHPAGNLLVMIRSFIITQWRLNQQ